jgi:chitin synthase
MNLTLISFVTNSLVPSLINFFQLSQDFQLGNYKIFKIFNVKEILVSIPDIINFLYIISVFSVLLWSLQVNHNNSKFKVIYYGASTLLGVYGILVLALLFYNTYSIIQATATTEDINETGQFVIPLIYLRALILFVVVGMTLPIIWTLSFRKTVELITSLLSYIFFSPTYINILQIFAFCRIDDLSWGTKGLDKDEKNSQISDW